MRRSTTVASLGLRCSPWAAPEGATDPWRVVRSERDWPGILPPSWRHATIIDSVSLTEDRTSTQAARAGARRPAGVAGRARVGRRDGTRGDVKEAGWREMGRGGGSGWEIG